MGLSNDLISQFVEITKQDKDNQNGATVYGTIKKLNGQDYVQIDGSELMTPIKSTTYVSDGERVTVMIKNHQAIVTGNITSPAARQTDVDTTVDQKIAEFDIIVTDQIEAQYGKFEQLVTDNITAVNGEIENLKTENLEVKDTLIAQNGEIENLKTKKLDAETANITFATIESLKATDIEVNNIKGNFAEFSQITTDNITAVNGEIENLKAEKLNVADADIKYANIDFANIGMAAVEELFVKSGIIKDIVVGDQHITGELVGVTIKGDLIEGNTIVAEKLVVKGSDGLYYKLNTDGMKIEAQQTEYNSLNGSIITAKSITASKVMVDDLVAFDATIGGFKITDNAIYSGVKTSVNNTTTGVYLDNTGQIAFGDSNNYIKFFKDVDNQWKLMISASSMKMSTSNKTVEEAISDINEQVQGTVKLVETYYAISDSYTVPPTTGWSKNTPTWVNGKYIWSKTKTTYIDGSSTESNPACITGAKGESGTSGSAGKGIKNITNYYLATSTNSGITVSTSGWTTTMQKMTSTNKYLWNYETITYTDNSTTKTNPVIIGVYGDKGQNGAAGEDGVGIVSITEKYAVSSSNSTAPTTWYDTVQTMTSTNRYLWNYEIVKYTNNTTSETAKRVIGVYGDKGDRGLQGLQGPKGDQGIPGTNGTDGKTSYFHIKYSSVAKPTSSSQMTETPNTYIGTYVDYTAADSTDPTKYTWSRFEGLQGPKGDQGIPGTNGTNGKTSYLHIKYSNDGGKTFTANNGEEPGDWIGQYTDFNVNDSTSVTAYTWSLIKGEAGVGITSVDVEYYLSTSATSLSGGSWSTTAPAWVNGKYMWSRTKTVNTTGTTTYSNPACITGAKGSTGATGATGTGISSITEEYYLSTSKTTQTGGSWTTTPPTWSVGKYVWTRSKIVYSNPTSTVYTTPICDSSWEAVNDIEISGRNLALFGSFSPYSTAGYTTVDNTNFTKDGSVRFSRQTVLNEGPIIDRYVVYENGKDYVISFKLKTVTGDVDSISLYNGCGHTEGKVYIDDKYVGPMSQTLAAIAVPFPSDNEYHDVRITFKGQNGTRGDGSTINTTHTILQPMKTSKTSYTMDVLNYKVEKGNKSTGWSPAPEDITNAISVVEKKASDAILEVSKDKIIQKVSDTFTTKTESTALKNQLDQNKQNIRCNNVGAKINYSAFSTPNSGEIYLHGYDNNNNPIDANGLIYWNGATVSVPKGMINPNTNCGLGNDVYIVMNKSNAAVFGVWYDSTSKNWKFQRFIGGTDSGTLTLLMDHIAIGMFNMKDAETFNYAFLFDNPQSLRNLTVGVADLITRMNTAEQKITPNAIISTVTSSSSWSEVNKKLLNNFSISGNMNRWTTTSNTGTIRDSDTVGKYLDITTTGNVMAVTDKEEIDPLKSYKVSLMVQVPCTTGTGSWYFGLYAYDKNGVNIGVYLNAGTTLNTNAYFHSEVKAKQNTSWRTFESYIYGANVDVDTKSPKGNCYGFAKLHGKTKYIAIRFLHFRGATDYGDGSSGSMYFAHPTISEIDGLITDTNSRLNSAEQKITPTAILQAVNTQIGAGGQINTVSTILDKTGFTVKNGALKVQNKSGQTVLSGDTNGNLVMSGSININTQNSQQLYVNTSDSKLPILVSKSKGTYCQSLAVTNEFLAWNNENTWNGVSIKPSGISTPNLNASSISTNGTITASIVHATSNSQGTNFKVGDDCWIGDINEANTMSVKGVSNSNAAYIKLGAGGKIGHNGSGGSPIDLVGNTWVDGVLTASDSLRATNKLYFTRSDTGYWLQAKWSYNRYSIEAPNFTGNGLLSNDKIYLRSKSSYGGMILDTGGYFYPEQNNGVSIGHPNGYRISTLYYTNLSAASDLKLKENISYINTSDNQTMSVDEVINTKDFYTFVKDELRLATFDYKTVDKDEQSNRGKIGFIAQDISETKVGKHLLKKDEIKQIDLVDVDKMILDEGETVLSYDLTDYVNVLAGALQEATKKIDLLENENMELKERLSKLENLVNQIISK